MQTYITKMHPQKERQRKGNDVDADAEQPEVWIFHSTYIHIYKYSVKDIDPKSNSLLQNINLVLSHKA